ncbi:glycoside hydrolase [Streptomyces bauhiniae]|uniref:Glycoside hydrolase n=1 Tax=Streptomyces bauhiniae TaxID=2340725 RepID=A0A7K3QVP0_9ACTN|nr:glycoside hydrolase [Streptomyces bauhiniae]NEB93984.1 glycoside hydrolase [Streptomyces bauhiniae]
MHVKSRRLRPLLAALVLAAGSVTALTATTGSAHADAQVCDQFGSVTTPGGYVVQNNAWGTSAPQCVTQAGDGFQLTRADGSVPTNGAPKSYPSIFAGCHYTNCSPGTNLPKRIGSIGSVPSSIAYQYVGGAVYDAAYDIWLDPTPKTDGVNKTEIMIWLDRTGPIQPIGTVTGTVSLAGQTWDVWRGSNGQNDVISYVAPSSLTGLNFDIKEFIDHTVSQGLATPDWYLTSVQAGFEPWENGAGLAVTNFSVAVN